MSENSFVKSFGVIPSKVDKRDYQLEFEKAGIVELPESYSSPLPPFEKNQGTAGICTNASLSRWFERQYELQNKAEQEFSMTWLYAHKPDKDGSGAQLRDILKLANSLGDCKNELFSYIEDVPDIFYDLDRVDQAQVENDSKQHIVKEFAQITNITDIKLAIMKYSYVYVCIPWYECPNAYTDRFSDNFGDYLNVYAPSDDKTIKGYHAILIYGWHQDNWKFVNTWGNQWENSGCAELSPDYPLIETWSLIGDYEEPQKTPTPTPQPIIHKKSDNIIIQILWKIVNWFINKFIKN